MHLAADAVTALSCNTCQLAIMSHQSVITALATYRINAMCNTRNTLISMSVEVYAQHALVEGQQSWYQLRDSRVSSSMMRGRVHLPHKKGLMHLEAGR